MKKIFSLVLMLLMITGFSVCHATISTDRMNAGGINLGQSISQVVSMYGQPTDKFKPDGNLLDTYTWDNGKINLTVLFSKGVAFDIRVFKDGISTSDGIHVGMSVSDVKRILGTPDSEVAPNKAKRMRHVIEYRDSTKTKGMLFIMENGVVTQYHIFG